MSAISRLSLQKAQNGKKANHGNVSKTPSTLGFIGKKSIDVRVSVYYLPARAKETATSKEHVTPMPVSISNLTIIDLRDYLQPESKYTHNYWR